jgi:4-amino-4-deoxy-L-arabinose transferase-like glycosyltransferase
VSVPRFPVWPRFLSVPHFIAYFWIALFVLSNVVLFSSRAVHLDEPFFLALARTPRTHGLFFEDREWIFFGTHYPMFGGGSHPTAVIYYLAGLFSVLGTFREATFRILYSIFAVAAAFGFYGLARRFCNQPLGITLLFLASPAFFVMAPTLMMDIPMLAFLLLGLHFYFHGIDARPPRLILSAICFSLSALSGYTALIPLGCLLFAGLLTREPKSHIATVAVAPGAVAAWILMTTAYYHKDPVTPVIRYFASLNSIAHNALATPSFLGGVTTAPWLFLLLLSSKDKWRLKGRLIASIVAAAALSLFIDWQSVGYGLWFILLASSGIGLLVIFAIQALRTIRSRWTFEEIFLVLWFPATLLFFVLVAQFTSARYLLLAMPPLYLLLLGRSTTRSIVAVFVPTLIVSLLVATADYRFVNAYRTWVSTSVAPLQNQGFRILGGAESGLRFYLEQRGITTLATTDLHAEAMDLVVRHSTLFRYSLSEHIETMLMVLRTYELNDRFPIRTFSQEAGAGFHGSSLGMVPFTVSRAPYDRLEISEMSPLVRRLPQTEEPGKPHPVWGPAGPILIQNESELSFPLVLPKNAKVEYELDGQGSVEIADGSIKLRKSGAHPVIWKNFRIVPQ